MWIFWDEEPGKKKHEIAYSNEQMAQVFVDHLLYQGHGPGSWEVIERSADHIVLVHPPHYPRLTRYVRHFEQVP